MEGFGERSGEATGRHHGRTSESVYRSRNLPEFGVFSENLAHGPRAFGPRIGKIGENYPHSGGYSFVWSMVECPREASMKSRIFELRSKVLVQALDCTGVGIYSLCLINTFIAHKKPR